MTPIDPDLERSARSARDAEIARNSQADDDDLERAIRAATGVDQETAEHLLISVDLDDDPRGELVPRPLTHRAQLQLWRARRLRALRTRNLIALATAKRRGVKIPKVLHRRIRDTSKLDYLAFMAETGRIELELERAHFIEQAIRNALAGATLKQRDPKRFTEMNLVLGLLFQDALTPYHEND